MFKPSVFFQKFSRKQDLPAQLDTQPSAASPGVIVPPTEPIPPLVKTPFLTPANLRLLLISSLILIVGGAGWLTWQNGWLTKIKPIPASAQVILTADDEESDGVSPTTTFTLQSDEALSPASVKANLKSDPPVDFKVSRITPTSLTLTPAQPLDQETVYKFALATDTESQETLATWAFQTQGQFRVTQTMPRDKATSVATNTSIELTFSHEKFADPDKFVSFDPPLEGRWERHYQTAVFLPKNLAPNKIYTVKVDKKLGLAGTDKTLASDRIFRFETSRDKSDNFWLSTNREMMEFGPEEIPAMTMNATYSDPEFQVKVLAFNTGDDFAKSWAAKQTLPIWSSSVRDSYQAQTTGLREVASFTAQLQKNENFASYFNFPEALPTGWYLVQVTVTQNQQTKTVYAWIQVSDLAIYTSVSQTDSLVWAMNRANGQPAAKAKVKLWGQAELGETNDSGVAIFKTPSDLSTTQKLTLNSSELDEDRPAQLLQIQAGDKSLYVPSFAYRPSSYGMAWGGYDSGAQATAQFWQYLNLDKPMYKPGDAVRFWGMIRDRDTQKIPAETLAVKITTGYGYGKDQAKLASGPSIKLANDGTFIGEVTLPQLKPGAYFLELSDGDEVYFNQMVAVETYVKPAYTLDLNLNKRAVFLGENYEAKGRAAFFEGTPLPKLPVKISGGNNSEAGVEAITDAAGNFTANIAAKFAYSGYEGSQPQTQYVSVMPKRAEEGEINASDTLLVFPSKYILTSQQHTKNDQATIDLKVNAVDLSTIKSQYPSQEEYSGKPVAGVSLPVSVIRVKYDKVETGETYNPILKTVEKNYRYDRKEEPVKDETVTTNDQGLTTLTVPIAKDEQLIATVTLKDNENRQTKEKVYLYGQSGDGYQGSFANNQLNLMTAKELALEPTKRSSVMYSIGEAISLLVKKGEDDAPVNDQTKYLLRLSQRGLRSVIVNNKPEFNYTYTAKDAPNLVASAIQFDGKRFHDAGSKWLEFDTQTKKLTVNVSPNQDKYIPGDKVTLNVAVTSQDGKPQKTTLNLNVLDKAMLALRGANADILSSLYARVSSGVFFSYTSHQDPRVPNSEGGGGGGDDRTVFKDVAFFQNVTTDDQGKAKVEFKLPDNLTAWRVLAEGVGGENPPLAGSAVKEITVTQPAYVVVNLAEEYLAGDKPVLQLKAYGDDLKENQNVEFYVEGKSIGIEGRKTHAGKAFVPTLVELPALPAGTHNLVVGMKAGGFEDKLTRQISVKASRLVRPASLVLPVSANQNLAWPEVKSGMVEISFSNPLLNQVRSTANALQYSWNDRLDSRLARNLALDWLAQDAGQSLPPEQNSLYLSIYQAKNGMNLLPRSDEDLYFSMLTALVATGKVDKSELTTYFQKILHDSKQGRLEQIMALTGLAGLQQPTLLDLKQLVAVKDLSVQERVYAAAGAAAVGDQTLAGQLLQPVIDQAQTSDKTLIVKDAPNPDQQQQLTWLAAAVASGIKHPQALKLVNGANSLYTKETMVNLERSFFVKQASLANLTKESTLSVKVGDELLTQTLNAKKTKLTVMVPADQLATVQVNGVQGDVSALLVAEIPVDPNSATDPDFKVQRHYQVDGKDTSTAQEGQLVEINLPYTVTTAKQLNGCVQITDWLPAGLRVVTQPRFYSGIEEMASYPYEVNNQKVSFCVGSAKTKPDSMIRYYARIVNIGTFKTDPALIQPMQLPGNYGLSQPSTITITASE